jgi:crotonobetainyl-CoA:carnitine CoA-transferase CaiB-like acyl-CoA transferase
MEGFLEGYRILDLTDEKGHLCGRILGDMGADVIKIEPPGGDPSRNVGPFYHDEPDPEKSLTWFFANANKRGITLDLQSADGRELFKQMAKGADIILESFRPGYMEGLGLGYASLAGVNPGVILTSITPFGQSGPYAQYKVTDLVAVSMGGMAYLWGDEDRAPVRISAPQAYFLGAQHAAIGALFALYHREMRGEGQWVDVSMYEAIIFALTYHIPSWEHGKTLRPRSGPSFPRPRPFPLPVFKTRWMFSCKDGQVCLSFQGGNSAAVKSAYAMTAWANEEGYALELSDYQWEKWNVLTIEQSRQEELESIISPFLLTKTKTELLEGAAKRKILLAPVFTAADLAQNPQFASRGFWCKVFHPELNEILMYPGPSVQVPQCPQQIYRRAPVVGEHNREIFQGELGLSGTQLTLLKGQGVI